MKRELKAQELIDFLEKKTAQLEGKAIISQLDEIKEGQTYSTKEILNKMYDNGFNRGYVMGARDILIDLATMMQLDDPTK